MGLNGRMGPPPAKSLGLQPGHGAALKGAVMIRRAAAVTARNRGTVRMG